MHPVAALIQDIQPSACLLIPTCTTAPAADSWQPGILSFQLVISGQIPTTPWCEKEETILRRGGLICVAPGGASTRRYDVARKHLSFHVHNGEVLIQLFQRQAHDDPGFAHQETWYFPAPSALIELSQLLTRGFREKLDEECLKKLALSLHLMLLHYLQHEPTDALSKAQTWLRDHAHEDLDRNDLADYLDCHPDHVTRIFRQAHLSFADERKRLRCERVCDLLLNERLSLAEIAEQCGFNSETYLIRSFRQIYGCTPGVWRRRHDWAE